MPAYSFILNGEKVSVDVDGNVRLLWVLRDICRCGTYVRIREAIIAGAKNM